MLFSPDFVPLALSPDHLHRFLGHLLLFFFSLQIVLLAFIFFHLSCFPPLVSHIELPGCLKPLTQHSTFFSGLLAVELLHVAGSFVQVDTKDAFQHICHLWWLWNEVVWVAKASTWWENLWQSNWWGCKQILVFWLCWRPEWFLWQPPVLSLLMCGGYKYLQFGWYLTSLSSKLQNNYLLLGKAKLRSD